MCVLHIPAAFCLGDRDFVPARSAWTSVPSTTLWGLPLSRPLCEKPECPQPGKKRKATVAHTGKENEQEGGSSSKQKAAGMRSMRTKAGLHQRTTPLTRWLRTTLLHVAINMDTNEMIIA